MIRSLCADIADIPDQTRLFACENVRDNRFLYDFPCLFPLKITIFAKTITNNRQCCFNSDWAEFTCCPEWCFGKSEPVIGMGIRENVLGWVMIRAVFTCSLFLTAVTSAAGIWYPEEVGLALRKAAGNCAELERVLSHYEDKGDMLKYKAAWLLIASTYAHLFCASRAMSSCYDEMDGVFSVWVCPDNGSLYYWLL